MKELEKLYKAHFGEDAVSVVRLSASGSNRAYFRITGETHSAIGVEWENAEENDAFCYLANHFATKQLPFPRVFAVSENHKCYIQENLGDSILYDMVATGRKTGSYSTEEIELLKKAVFLLPKIQFEGAEGLDFSRCYPQSAFDRRMIDFDLNYFKYCFLKLSGIEFNEMKLQDDFDALADYLLKYDSDTFMYRDFQARNVMFKDGEPYFIDFQGGRRGPVYYDLASFVWQAKSAYPASLKTDLVSTYLEALAPYRSVNRGEFEDTLRYFVLFRTLQVLGAYGFRGLIEKKAHFIKSIPFAMANLKELLQKPFENCPYLSEILLQLAGSERFSFANCCSVDDKLTVEINSFSYKKGIPEDYSGNGGGYVFDCRSIHNPGKYEQYKNMTGFDEPVIKFLEDDGEVFPFLENVYSLADKHIQKFIERGFTHLCFSFGCTGGHHRSVYCANHLAEYVTSKYDVNVKLNHRELTE